MRRHALNKILQEIRSILPKHLILALQTGSHLLDRDVGNIRNIRRTQVDHRVLVQPVVHPRHLAANTEVVNRLVRDGQCAVKVAALLHVPEFGAEGDDSQEIPGVVAEPLAELALLLGIDVARLQVTEEVVDDFVHQWFHGEHAGDGVVTDHGPLHAGVFGVVDFAEHVVGDFAVDDAAAVLVKVGLLISLAVLFSCS